MRYRPPTPPPPPPPPHRPHLHPARPLLPPLTAVDRKFLQASNAQTPFPRTAPTASTHCYTEKVLIIQASNACPNPSAPTALTAPTPPARPLLPPLPAHTAHTALTPLTAYTPTPHGPYCLYRESCLHSLLYIESSYRPPIKLHIARVDQHSSIARLGVGGTGGSH